MTQNLRITYKALTTENSDISSNFSVPPPSVSGFSEQDTNNAYADSAYGGYYTFYTATAGTGGTSLTSGNAPSSICPKGWRLPTSTEIQTLYNNYNSSELMRGEPGFILSGLINGNGAILNGGYYGLFWSSTVKDANNAYNLSLGKTNVTPVSDSYKRNGFSVRRIAR